SIAKAYNLTSAAGKAGMKDTRGVEIDHDFTERTTFVVAPDGKVLATLSSAEDKITPAAHVEKSLAVVQQYAASKTAK
ncbi:MAG TPA: hypothetical protein VH458_23755, partial [Vicinamibacterales bacterium]